MNGWAKTRDLVSKPIKKRFDLNCFGALVQLTKDSSESKSRRRATFFRLLPDVGRSFDLGNGIPRIVIFSPLDVWRMEISTTKQRRERRDFKQASRYAADLKRAEVYVVRGKHEG